MADFEPFFELKNQYRESCPVLLQSGALYREESTVSAEAEEIETAEATLPAEQEEAASPRTFLRLAFRNIDPRAVTSVYVDIHIFDKATNELAVVRDRRYLVPILGRDAVFGADEEIDVDDAAYSFSVAIKKVQFEGEDVFWNGSASLLFENLPEQAKIADVMEDEDLRAQYQRDFTEMAEDKEAAAQFAPQEYKDLWMCACGEVNHKDEEKCAACGAEYGPQHALFEDEEKLKENLEAYNKAEAEKAEAARIAAEKKAAEEKAAAEAAARKAAEEKAAAEEAARKKRLHRKIFLSISIPLAVLIAAFVVVLIVYIIPQYQRDFTEMAEDKEAAAQFAPQEYKDLWMCACGEVNHKDEEKCAACGAEYGPQHALFEDEEKLKENLEAYNKAEAEKAEAARIAAEKKAAEEKAAAEAAARKAAEEKAAAEEAARKKRLHRKIFLSISIPLAVLIAAFVVVLIVYIIPQNHYNDAAALLEAGKYDEAITAFTALDGYSDSAARITEAEYKKACDLLENEKFAEAIEAFTALGDYEDSKDRITEAEYRRAVKTFESGAYEDALNLLEPLKDYKDAAEKIETCHYELGMKALEADNLKSAAAHFKEVNAEQNKKMQAAFCDKGIAFYEKGDEEKALTYFEYVTDKDFLPKIDAAYYAQALKLVEDGEYDKATEIFTKLGEYEDCPTQLLRIHALKAEQYYNNADYENAIAEFKAAGDYGDAASRVTEATYRLGAQQLANGEVRKAYDTLYPIRSYDPAYMLLVSNSQFYIQIYDVGAGPNPLNEN